uniref:Uncharacterized protein n=1 Tax=Siphoviridae sp. ctmHK36 TaxID=2827931 RepID=A0A8S5TBD9_9CAUD|nr:MAG TPA: hypothetical protein [Siphoviridae sp. ctmHK36]
MSLSPIFLLSLAFRQHQRHCRSLLQFLWCVSPLFLHFCLKYFKSNQF